MKVTNIKLKTLEGKGRLKAIGSVTFDDEFVVKDVSVVEVANGLFISMPSRKDTDGKYRNVAFPTNSELRRQITKDVLAVYEHGNAEAIQEVDADE